MPELTALLEQALLGVTFHSSEGTVYSPGELRSALARSSNSVSKARKLLSARLEVADHWVNAIADTLRFKLSQYINHDNDRIGHSFRVEVDSPRLIKVSTNQLPEIQSVSRLFGFAKGVIRAAALLDPDTVNSLLSQWADGRPWRYKACIVLAGVYVDKRIALNRGVSVDQLAKTSEGLPISMPDMEWQAVGSILGNAMLEVDVSTHPALFDPSNPSVENVPLHGCTVLGDVSLNTFYLALSLVCNRRVGSAWRWNDFGNVVNFNRGERSNLWGPGMPPTFSGSGIHHEHETGITELTSFNPPVPNLDEVGLYRAWALSRELQRRIDADERFKIAVTRWAQAATPGLLNADRIVDLRIALEALYLDSSGGELGFRLSVTGARHTGTNLGERKDIYKSLVRFYGLASTVIHGSALTKKADVGLVDKAATLCRDGILKIVEERNQPKWNDVLLS